MAQDRRIGSLLGGVARSVGPSDQDIRSLERRRDEHARKTAKRPVRAFDEMLDSQEQADQRDQRRRRRARGEATPEDEAQAKAAEPGQGVGPNAAEPARGPIVPRGRGRLIRG